jgi:hypothetical protein
MAIPATTITATPMMERTPALRPMARVPPNTPSETRPGPKIGASPEAPRPNMYVLETHVARIPTGKISESQAPRYAPAAVPAYQR